MIWLSCSVLRVLTKFIKEVILNGMKWKDEGSFSTIHNYIDTEAGITEE